MIDAVHKVLGACSQQNVSGLQAAVHNSQSRTGRRSMCELFMSACIHAWQAMLRATYAVLGALEDVARFSCIIFVMVPGLAVTFVILGTVFFAPSIVMGLTRDWMRNARNGWMNKSFIYAVQIKSLSCREQDSTQGSVQRFWWQRKEAFKGFHVNTVIFVFCNALAPLTDEILQNSYPAGVQCVPVCLPAQPWHRRALFCWFPLSCPGRIFLNPFFSLFTVFCTNMPVCTCVRSLGMWILHRYPGNTYFTVPKIQIH